MIDRLLRFRHQRQGKGKKYRFQKYARKSFRSACSDATRYAAAQPVRIRNISKFRFRPESSSNILHHTGSFSKTTFYHNVSCCCVGCLPSSATSFFFFFPFFFSVSFSSVLAPAAVSFASVSAHASPCTRGEACRGVRF